MGRNQSAIMTEASEIADVPQPKVKKKMATTNKVKTLQADLKAARADFKEAKATFAVAKKALSSMIKEHNAEIKKLKAEQKPLIAEQRVTERKVTTQKKRVDSLIAKIAAEKEKA